MNSICVEKMVQIAKTATKLFLAQVEADFFLISSWIFKILIMGRIRPEYLRLRKILYERYFFQLIN